MFRCDEERKTIPTPNVTPKDLRDKGPCFIISYEEGERAMQNTTQPLFFARDAFPQGRRGFSELRYIDREEARPCAAFRVVQRRVELQNGNVPHNRVNGVQKACGFSTFSTMLKLQNRLIRACHSRMVHPYCQSTNIVPSIDPHVSKSIANMLPFCCRKSQFLSDQI